jgi:hypothetical protein
MYLTELALWLGWAVLYGSIIVLAGFVALCVVMSILAPREERALEAKFGEANRQYRARVPLWLGSPRGDRTPAEPTAEAGRGRHPGFLSFNVLAGGPGSLAERSAAPGATRVALGDNFNSAGR